MTDKLSGSQVLVLGPADIVLVTLAIAVLGIMFRKIVAGLMASQSGQERTLEEKIKSK